jgi:hypothetical protein
MSLKAISSCADTDLHHDSGSKAISGLVTGGLAQAKRERMVNVIKIDFFMIIMLSDTPTSQ